MEDRKLASIEKVLKVEDIEGKDKIKYATILGWHVIVGNDIKEGDLVVYVEYDTVLPVKPEFEFLRDRCYTSKFDGFRIRNMKMAGVFSEGIVFKIKDIPDLKDVKIKEGMPVAKLIGIKKYDLEELEESSKVPVTGIKKYFIRYKWFRKLIKKKKYGYPHYIPKSNETNIQVKYHFLKNKDYNYYTTEKLEGQAATYHVKKNLFTKDFKVYSHRVGLKKDNSNFWKIAIKYDIEKKLKSYMKKKKIKEMYIQGEIIGEGIQKNIYGIKGLQFYVYGGAVINKGIRKVMSYNDLKEFEDFSFLPMVPVLETDIKLSGSTDEILKKAEGLSLLNSKIKGLREGVIYRTMDGIDGFKAKSKKYQELFS